MLPPVSCAVLKSRSRTKSPKTSLATDRVDFRFLQSADRTRALANGTVDIVIRTMTITPDREKEIAFSQPYMITDTRMLVLTSSGITSVEQTSGRTLCAVEG